MKKLLLFIASGLAVTSLNAQQMRAIPSLSVGSETKLNKQITNMAPTSARTTAGGSRWFNAAESTGEYNTVDIYTTTLANFLAMWQDSSVTYVGSTRGINYQSIGQVMHSQSPLFSDPGLASNTGKIQVGATDAYTIDSVELMGYYDRINTSYTDTMIFTFVGETSNRKFAYFSYGGTVFTDHGVDSFGVQLYNNADWGVKPINQISYSVGGAQLATAVVVKVPMDNAFHADSSTSGIHTFRLAPAISMPAGTKVSVSATFKSGATYTPGTALDQYNAFYYMSHETVDGGFVNYVPGDLNQSSIVYKDTTNAGVNATLNMYVPSIAFTAPFAAELHNFSWKVSCPTCALVNVTDVAGVSVGDAYPNPANNSFEVPFSVKQNAEVSVSIANTLGQIIKTQNVGKFAAGQNGKATFSVADMANGVYFYTIEANGQRTTKRMVVAH